MSVTVFRPLTYFTDPNNEAKVKPPEWISLFVTLARLPLEKSVEYLANPIIRRHLHSQEAQQDSPLKVVLAEAKKIWTEPHLAFASEMWRAGASEAIKPLEIHEIIQRAMADANADVLLWLHEKGVDITEGEQNNTENYQQLCRLNEISESQAVIIVLNSKAEYNRLSAHLPSASKHTLRMVI